MTTKPTTGQQQKRANKSFQHAAFPALRKAEERGGDRERGKSMSPYGQL